MYVSNSHDKTSKITVQYSKEHQEKNGYSHGKKLKLIPIYHWIYNSKLNELKVQTSKTLKLGKKKIPKKPLEYQ